MLSVNKSYPEQVEENPQFCIVGEKEFGIKYFHWLECFALHY